MKISNGLTQQTDSYIQNEPHSAHIQLLEGLCVRLHGTVGLGNKAGAFTGSGVIVRVAQAETYVLTAKHNLHIAAKDANIPLDEFEDYFRKKIKVEFSKRDGGTVDGKIQQITVFDGKWEDENYDVALLRIAGPNTPAYANHVRQLMSGFAYYFTSMNWQHGKSNWLFDVLGRDGAIAVLANGDPHKNKYAVIDEYVGFSLLQLGYGLLTKDGLYGFRRRVLKIAEFPGESHVY